MDDRDQHLVEHASMEPVSARRPSCSHELGLGGLLRKNVGTALEYLWELSASIRRPFANIEVIHGRERHSGNRLSILYGGNYENYAFFLNLVYEQFDILEKHSAKLLLNPQRWIRKYENDIDLVFFDLELLYGKLLPGREWLAIPQWIRQKFIVPDYWSQVVSKFRKNTKKTDLRKVRKYGLSFRLTRNEFDFRRFYELMYRPYLKKRFKDQVIIEPKWKFMRQCHKGTLMQVLRDDEVIAAVLLHTQQGRLAYVWVGVPNHIDEEMYKGAFSALYYYTIVYGYNIGCCEIDFLGSRPLLNDGLFLYKRKWGTCVEDSPVPRGDILLWPIRFTKAIRSIFSNNFFITRNGCNLTAKILYDEGTLDKHQLIDLTSRYMTPGLKYMKIYCLYDYTDAAAAWAKQEGPEIVLVDLSEVENPARAYGSL